MKLQVSFIFATIFASMLILAPLETRAKLTEEQQGIPGI
jgi:hypothetical protein